MLVTKEKIELVDELHDRLWARLMAELSPEQIRLLQTFDGLVAWGGLARGDGKGVLADIIGVALEGAIGEALDLLPATNWPLSVCDLYPERG
jgi:hypothetical protein